MQFSYLQFLGFVNGKRRLRKENTATPTLQLHFIIKKVFIIKVCLCVFKCVCETNKDKATKIERQRDKGTKGQRDRKTKRQTDKEADRQRGRQTEIQRDKEAKRKRDRERQRDRDDIKKQTKQMLAHKKLTTKLDKLGLRS